MQLRTVTSKDNFIMTIQLSTRAASLLPKWAIVDNVPEGIKTLAAYAAKRPRP